jgi:CBS domain containing-hemolysin-like protein
MLHAIFDFGELLVRQVMIPRTEITGVEADASMDEILNVVNQSTYTKLPVYEDDLDLILGIIHVKDLLRVLSQPEDKAFNARSLLREPLYVPETLPVNDLLHKFRQNRQHIAIVMDEYGGTAGLITLEDLLEEIVGEVSDPFDEDFPEIQTLPDGTMLVDGLALIEDINQQLDLNLQDPHYDTIAGFLLGKLGRIPKVGDTVVSEGARFTVESMDGLRIARLSVKRPKKGDN